MPYDGIVPFSYDNVKTCFQNSDYIRESLLRRMELSELLILESRDLNLKACAFKFLIVLLLCYNIQFYFNYSIFIIHIDIIKYQYLKVKNFAVTALQLLYPVYS